jgi:hypothetical protein
MTMESIKIKYLLVLPFALLVACADSKQISTSAVKESFVASALEDSKKTIFAANVVKINNLVAAVKEAEDDFKKNPTNKNSYLAKLSTSRNEISAAYVNCANLIDGEIVELITNFPSEVSLFKEVANAIREVSLRVKHSDYPLNEFHPEKIVFKDSNIKTNSPSIYFDIFAIKQMKSVKAEVDMAKYLNDRERSVSALRKMREVYLDQAKIIAINDPRLVDDMKKIIDNESSLIDAVKSGKDPIPSSDSLHLEKY